jgi:hypothetical protein
MTAPVVVCEPRVGEPSLLFHEFIFLLSRIAITNVSSQATFSGKLKDFFETKLGFKEKAKNKVKLAFEDYKKKDKRAAVSEEDEYGSEYDDEDWDSDEAE